MNILKILIILILTYNSLKVNNLYATDTYQNNNYLNEFNYNKSTKIFIKDIKQLTFAAHNSNSAIRSFSNNLFIILSILLIFKIILEYIQVGLDLNKLLYTSILIIFTKQFLQYFDIITLFIINWSNELTGHLEQLTLGQYFTNSNLTSSVDYIRNLTSLLHMDQTNILTNTITEIFNYFIISLLNYILNSCAYISIMWSIWGYGVCNMIGLIFIPTILSPYLSWLFDGWLKCFLSYLIFSIFSRINLILLVKLISSIFTEPNTNINHAIHISLFNIHHITGLLSLLLLGILALLYTFKLSWQMVNNVSNLTTWIYKTIQQVSYIRF